MLTRRALGPDGSWRGCRLSAPRWASCTTSPSSSGGSCFSWGPSCSPPPSSPPSSPLYFVSPIAFSIAFRLRFHPRHFLLIGWIVLTAGLPRTRGMESSSARLCSKSLLHRRSTSRMCGCVAFTQATFLGQEQTPTCLWLPMATRCLFALCPPFLCTGQIGCTGAQG